MFIHSYQFFILCSCEMKSAEVYRVSAAGMGGGGGGGLCPCQGYNGGITWKTWCCKHLLLVSL